MEDDDLDQVRAAVALSTADLSSALRGLLIMYEGEPCAPTFWRHCGVSRLHYDDTD